MDNQQEREFAYIAGIVDGEGCITMAFRQYRLGKFRIEPKVEIANTSSTLLDWLSAKLTEHSIGHHITWHAPQTPQSRPWAALVIQRYNSIVNFLERILPYLVIKRLQGETVRGFLKTRLLPDGRSKKNGITDPYTLEDFQALAKVRALNRSKRDLDPQRLYAEYCARRTAKI